MDIRCSTKIEIDDLAHALSRDNAHKVILEIDHAQYECDFTMETIKLLLKALVCELYPEEMKLFISELENISKGVSVE